MDTALPSNRKIARNTLMLYIRMLLTTLVGLYTSRVVLHTLGVQDYGIIGLVGGIVSILGFLNTSLSGSTSRFITIDLGRGDKSSLSITFTSSFQSHLLLALGVVFILETVGLWILTHYLIIPPERMAAAHWVFQFSVLSVVVGFTQVPYTALIMAHEQMDIYAYLEVLSVILKLVIVWVLQIAPFDHLIFYSLLSFLVTLLVQLLYRWYCYRHYPESHLHSQFHSEKVRQLLSFASWNLYADGGDSIRQQGISVIINRFFGVVLNASCGLALMVQGAFWSFGYHVLAAFRPQIVKQYARGNFHSQQQLIAQSMQYTVLLFSAVAVPAMFCMHYLMQLWLGEVPVYVIVLTQILIIDNLFGLINHIVYTAIQAHGQIRRFCFVNGSLKLFCLPCIIILLHFFQTPALPFLFDVIVLIPLLCYNVFLLKRYIPQLRIFPMLKPLFCSCALVGVVGCIVFALHRTMGEGMLQFIVDTVTFIALLGAGTYAFLLSQSTRTLLLRKMLWNRR